MITDSAPSMKELALNYVADGYPVFPLKPNKAPRTRNGYNDASTDPKKIKQWWNKYHDAAIGLPTGSMSGLCVVDIDVKNGHNGLGSLEQIKAKIGDWTTFTVKTTSGGFHHYFTCEVDVRSRANMLDGIDIRGNGGYVVAAGSVIDDNKYTIIDAVEPAPIPAPLVEWINQKPSTKTGDQKSFNKGERNDGIFKLASKLRGKGIKIDEAVSECMEVARRCNPPLSDAEVLQCVESAYNRYQPNQKVPDDDLLKGRSLGDREESIPWVPWHSEKMRPIVMYNTPIVTGGFIKVYQACIDSGRLTESIVRNVSGLTGDDLTVLIELLQCDGELFYLDHVDQEYEEAYGRILINRSNGKKGGRPQKKPTA